MQLGKVWLKTQKLLHLISETQYRQGKVRYLPHVDKTKLQKEIVQEYLTDPTALIAEADRIYDKYGRDQ